MFKLFNYEVYFLFTSFALTPITGTNHVEDLDTNKIKEYVYFFVWLWFQVEIYKTV